jgi:thioredoxin 1
LRFATFDLDGNPDTPERFGVRGVPEYILFRDGIPTFPMVGVLTKDQLREIFHAK